MTSTDECIVLNVVNITAVTLIHFDFGLLYFSRSISAMALMHSSNLSHPISYIIRLILFSSLGLKQCAFNEIKVKWRLL